LEQSGHLIQPVSFHKNKTVEHSGLLIKPINGGNNQEGGLQAATLSQVLLLTLLKCGKLNPMIQLLLTENLDMHNQLDLR